MTCIMKLFIKLNIPILNYGIYEKDIHYFGGSVIYQDNILTKSRRSKVEEAIIVLDDLSCHVYMERFRDGSAALQYFIKNGMIEENEIYPEKEQFLDKIFELYDEDAHFRAHVRRRKLMQKLTLAVQLLCLIIYYWSAYTLWNIEFRPEVLILYILSPVMIFVWGLFYKYYRLMEITPATD